MKSANDWHRQLTDMGARIARWDIAAIQEDATEELLAACKVGVSTITDILKADDRGDVHSGMGGYWINLRATLHIIRDAIAKSKLPAEPKEEALPKKQTAKEPLVERWVTEFIPPTEEPAPKYMVHQRGTAASVQRFTPESARVEAIRQAREKPGRPTYVLKVIGDCILHTEVECRGEIFKT